MNPFESQLRGRQFSVWAKSCLGSFPESIIKDLVVTEEVIFSKYNHFKIYDDKTILIVGGGPSTLALDFNSTQRDFTWSVNHFFLNPILKNIKIDLAMMMAEPDINSEKFIRYRDTYNPMIGFEIHDKWGNFNFDSYENYFLMHTDFYGKLGACTRMIIFACLLGAKCVKFVGMDGDKYMIKGEHAFEPNKNNLPSFHHENLFADQYNIFWKYVDSRFPDVKFENLGLGQEYHNR